MLSVVIVNWNGSRDTEELLDSLQRQAGVCIRCIIVDNGSSEDDRQRLNEIVERAKHDSDVTIDVNWLPTNGGFAAGANAGLNLALATGSRYVWLLNNDIILPANEDFAAEVVRFMEDHPNIGVYSTKQVDSTGKRHRIASHLVNRWGFVQIAADEVSGAVDVFVGSSLLIRREVLDKGIRLPTEYFHYYEDTEFCLDVGEKTPFGLYYDAERVMLHKGGQSLKSTAKSRYYMTRNSVLFARRKCSMSRYLLHHFFEYVKQLFPVRTALQGDWNSIFARWLGLYDGIRDRGGPCPWRLG